jgi:hypothetical protein
MDVVAAIAEDLLDLVEGVEDHEAATEGAVEDDLTHLWGVEARPDGLDPCRVDEFLFEGFALEPAFGCEFEPGH